MGRERGRAGVMKQGLGSPPTSPSHPLERSGATGRRVLTLKFEKQRGRSIFGSLEIADVARTGVCSADRASFSAEENCGCEEPRTPGSELARAGRSTWLRTSRSLCQRNRPVTGWFGRASMERVLKEIGYVQDVESISSLEGRLC
ncbi:hypothetical protein ACP70R_033958 [Stipagrostis hirtigluma subsp. patula]